MQNDFRENPVRYREIRGEIRNGDLLLFRKRKYSPIDLMIAVAGRGMFVHAGKAAWWQDDLFCLDVAKGSGGRATRLSELVRDDSARIDVFRPNAGNRWTDYDPEGSVAVMRRFVGKKYGYRQAMKTAMTHLPFFRLFFRPDRTDAAALEHDESPFCSQAVAIAERLGGGVDPVPNLSDDYSEPADLARSPFYQYVFTLTR